VAGEGGATEADVEPVTEDAGLGTSNTSRLLSLKLFV
jgi:hypothetical protein